MILLTYGTRPEFIKIKPLINELVKQNIPFKTLFTGQHNDIVSKDSDFILEMKELCSNRLDNIIQNCMNIPEKYFEDIKYVLVQGDTTSVVGISLSALHRKIKVIHLEAGLRSYDYDNPYPEENNRKIVTTIADIHLCPTENNKNNLLKENICENRIFVVGNTSIDNLVGLKNKTTYRDKVLITLHRRENHKIMNEWFSEINKIAKNNKNIEFILPIHPNPNVSKFRNILSDVKIINPVSHDELLKILLECKLVITDSGGIQEECSYFHKKCLVCRKITERPESIGITTFMVDNPKNINKLFVKHYEEYFVSPDNKCPYGNGYSSEIICKILKDLLYEKN